MPPVTSPTESVPVAIVLAWAPASSEQVEDTRDDEEGDHAHRQFDHPAPDRPRVSITVLTARGAAASHLGRFQDAWADLTAEDRAWFAEWLRDLLIDAVEGGVPS